jgi:hypothetical protein
MRNIKRLVLLMVAGLVLATGFVATASAQSMKMGYIKDDEIRKLGIPRRRRSLMNSI